MSANGPFAPLGLIHSKGRSVRNSVIDPSNLLRSRPMSAFLAAAQLLDLVNHLAASASMDVGPCLLRARCSRSLRFVRRSVFALNSRHIALADRLVTGRHASATIPE